MIYVTITDRAHGATFDSEDGWRSTDPDGERFLRELWKKFSELRAPSYFPIKYRLARFVDELLYDIVEWGDIPEDPPDRVY